MKKLTTEEFIEKAKQIHGNKYDYSKVNYINCKAKVCIICPEHGEFWQMPSNHLIGNGCPKCAKEKVNAFNRLTKEEFIEKANQIHDNKYDYSKAKYVNTRTKICIICHEHGEFWQTPNNHLKGSRCPECWTEKEKCTTDSFIVKARKIHGNKYDYSKVKYINNKTKVCIVCPIHGDFWQMPNNHLTGYGCQKCAGTFMDRESFIEKANQIHNNKYDYSKVEYINNYTKVHITCTIHGEFMQTPHSHLNGSGCPKCAGRFMNQEYFVEKARKIHGNKYDYSKVNYANTHAKVCIICPEHGEFWQTPKKHLNGQGCPKCNMSHLERDVMLFLERHNINYEHQKRFKWLSRQSLDFYLPDYNIAIECQGRQHYEPVTQFGGEEEYKKVQERDKKKKELCEQHNIKLRYYK